MGIRIHKTCGYGLADVVNGDRRFNWKSSVFTYEREPTCRDYLVWLAARRGIDATRLHESWLYEDLKLDAPLDCVTYVWPEEVNDSGVLVVRPAWIRGWYRFDDTIDYLEAGQGEDLSPRVQKLEGGIFPFNGTWMDARTGERVAAAGVTLNAVERLLASGNGEIAVKVLNNDAFSTPDEIRQFLVPHVPDDVREVCEFFELFTSSEAAWALRPMIFTWWA